MPTTKANVPRITIAYSNRRGVLESVLRDERKKYPKADAKLSGGPGNWKVKRDAQEGEDPSTHRAIDMKRSL